MDGCFQRYIFNRWRRVRRRLRCAWSFDGCHNIHHKGTGGAVNVIIKAIICTLFQADNYASLHQEYEVDPFLRIRQFKVIVRKT